MKPIIFSTPMVQAILEGRKTQTRRVIKINGYPITSPEESLELTKEGLIYHSFCSMSGYYKLLCQPGDILWVRETWCKNENPNSPNYGGYEYYADYEGTHCQSLIKWRSPIFMPREAARLFLKVKTVRVERLHDITENDARNEGVKDPYDYQEPSYYNQPHVRGMEINKSAFAGLWDNLNAKRGYSWETNPWVWAIEFERINKKEVERLEGLK